MSEERGISRRTFVGTGIAAGVLGAAAGQAAPASAAPVSAAARGAFGEVVGVAPRLTAATWPGELGTMVFPALQSAPPVSVSVVDPGFEAKSASWYTVFGAPKSAGLIDGVGRGAGVGGRIIVPTGATISFPKIAQDIASPPPAGAYLELTVWVKTDTVSGAYGAYVGVDFLNSAGARITYMQSSGLNGTNDWTKLTARGTVPAGTTKLTINLMLNGLGTAYFDDVALARLYTITPAHAPTVALSSTSALLTAGLVGVGVQNNPFGFADWGAMTPARLAVVEDRLAQLRPSWVRVFATPSWWGTAAGARDYTGSEVNGIAETVRVYAQYGTKVNLVLYRPADWDPTSLPWMRSAMIDLVTWLRTTKGLDNVAAITLCNEPDRVFPSTSDYAAFHSAMRAELDAAGYEDIILIGADVAGGPAGLFENVAATMAASVGQLSFHHYPVYNQSLASSLTDATTFGSLTAASTIPKVVEWEANMYGVTASSFGNAKAADGTRLLERFPSALTYAAYALQVLASGVHGFMYWEVFDMYYGADLDPTYLMINGLWSDTRTGMTLRHMYYPFSLVAKFVEPGANVRQLVPSATGALVTTLVENPDGSRVLYVVNPWPDPTDITFDWGASASTLEKYVCDQTAVSTAVTAQSLFLPHSSVTTTAGVLAETIPAESLVVFRLPSTSAVAVTTEARAIVRDGAAFVQVTAVNREEQNVDIRLISAYGEKKFSKVAPGRAVTQSFATGGTTAAAGSVTTAAYRWDGVGHYDRVSTAYAAS